MIFLKLDVALTYGHSSITYHKVCLNKCLLSGIINRETGHITIVLNQSYLSCVFGKKIARKECTHFPLSGPNGFPALPTEDTSHFNVPFLNQLFSMFKSNTRKCKLWSQFKSCTPLGLDGPETPPKFWFYIPFPQVKMSSLSNCNSHSRFKKKHPGNTIF